MRDPTPARLLLVCLLMCLPSSGGWAETRTPPALVEVENAFADLNDARGAISLIDSGLRRTYGGNDRKAWQQVQQTKAREVQAGLAKISETGLSPADARAAKLMRASVQALVSEGESSAEPVGKCKGAQSSGLDYKALRQALYACFDEIASNLEFEGKRVSRLSAFELLTTIEEPERRKQVFLAFVPLWQAINGKNEAESPYRRMIGMAAAQVAKNGSEIDAAARTLGVSAAEVEKWLEQILDTWRQVSGDQPIEPWDYRYWGGEADRMLAHFIPRASLAPLSERYFRNLGADLKKLGVLYDLDPRPGKAPLAYMNYVRMGRMVRGKWRPTVARVSANYARGGLGLLGELVHENAHAAHMMAVRTRPAFMDLGDTLFLEAFADVPSWNLYEPAWQRKYLGRSVAQSASLRSLYSGVMLDVAWALFELRMLRAPAGDPNQVWTEITSRYLHIVPHPEWSWWAVRVQLVDSPGYMVNYGLGAVVTADLRQRIREQLGPFDTGRKDWYAWISQRLLRFGEQRETAELLRDFLGRPISPQAFLTELRRLAPPQK